MFRKVVVALDGSEESKKAAELAEAIARRFRSEVLVVHVRELAYTGGGTWDSEWAPEVEASMAALVSRLTAQGRPARSEMPEAPEGHEGHAIADAAAKMGAELIVMGSRGRSRVAGAVLGSVAGSVIHHASCPVLWPDSRPSRPSMASNASAAAFHAHSFDATIHSDVL